MPRMGISDVYVDGLYLLFLTALPFSSFIPLQQTRVLADDDSQSEPEGAVAVREPGATDAQVPDRL